MANFWDLPEAVRKKIYRLHLIQDDPITYDDYKKFCGCTRSDAKLAVKSRTKRNLEIKVSPRLLQAHWKLDFEASHIYFGENTFELGPPEDITLWVRRLRPHQLNLIQSIILKSWAPVKYKKIPQYAFDSPRCNTSFKRIGRLKSLQRLTVVIDEEAVLKAMLGDPRCIIWHHSLDRGPQVDLQLLKVGGMAGFRSIRGIRFLEFLKNDPSSIQGPTQLGSITGGFLETTIRHEIMQPRDNVPYIRAHHFRFPDLPAEIRNMIYGFLLTFPGPTYPIDELPTSVTSKLFKMRQKSREALRVTPSALELLCTNRQIQKEAIESFYLENDFVFSEPKNLQAFISSLHRDRLDIVRNVTLIFNRRSALELELRATLLILRLLPGLRTFHLLLELASCPSYPKYACNPAASIAPQIYPTDLPGVECFFRLRNIADIVCLHLPAEEWRNNPRSKTKPGDDMASAYRHFSRGLQLAQEGTIVKELYANKTWHEDKLWPILDGSDCGVRKCCTCGPSGKGDGDQE